MKSITDPEEIAEEIAEHWWVAVYSGRTLCTNTEADARGHAKAVSVLVPHAAVVGFGDDPPVAVAYDGVLYDRAEMP